MGRGEGWGGNACLDPGMHWPVNVVRQQVEASQRWAQAAAKDIPGYEAEQQC